MDHWPSCSRWASFLTLSCIASGCARDCAGARDGVQTHLAKVQALALDSVKQGSTVVYYSSDREERARAVLRLVEGMLARYTPTHGPLDLRVAVLSQHDWKSAIENPYGVPGIRQPGPIAFMPSDVEEGVLFRHVLSLADSLPAELTRRIVTECKSLSACTKEFSDLIILHEIAHVFVERTNFGRPNLWLGEFAPDYLVYEFLREEQRPGQEAWTLVNAVTARMAPQVATLESFEQQRHGEGAFHRLEPELPRLHGILMERIPAVYARLGSNFLTQLASVFPKSNPRTACAIDGLMPVSVGPRNSLKQRFSGASMRLHQGSPSGRRLMAPSDGSPPVPSEMPAA